MKDQKDTSPVTEINTFLEKLEVATPAQVSSSLAAQIVQKIKDLKKKDEKIVS